MTQASGTKRMGVGGLDARSRVYYLLSRGFENFLLVRDGDLKETRLFEELVEAVRSLPSSYTLVEDLDGIVRLLGAGRKGEKSGPQDNSLLFKPEDLINCPPYETEYHNPHVFAQAQALADISGFYLAFKLQLSSTFKERPDYIGTELEFMHVLTIKESYARMNSYSEQAEICFNAQRKFLESHLAKWIPSFCAAVRRSSSSEYCQALVSLTAKFIANECRNLSIKPTKTVSLPQLRGSAAPECPVMDSCEASSLCR